MSFGDETRKCGWQLVINAFWLSVFGLLSNSSPSLAANVCCPPLYEFSIFTFSYLEGFIELGSESLETYI